ncbi:MAG: hypothetical protein M3203_08505, partial [Actinomycetota bacterium]|nr:hypothetical protein [Actinomycetota bacterium]
MPVSPTVARPAHPAREPAPVDPAGRHPGDVARVMAGSALVVATAVMAAGGRVPRLEADLFRLVNDLPPALSPPLQVLMQAGNFGAVGVAAAVAVAVRRRRLARGVAFSGTAAWVAAKVVKAMVARGRPGDLLAGVALRGATAAG